MPAQSPLPPGLFGYDEDYRNPFRQPDIRRARALLAEAGYKNGIDPATGQPLKLDFDVGNTTAAALLQYEFHVAAWRQIGLDVQIKATTYNQFQDKVRRGAYQIFTWGWIADFPDPENFLFLLICENARSKTQGPNTAEFCNAEFDNLYRAMKALPNDSQRADLIARMVKILEVERPWIELYHNESYDLRHAWVINSKSMGISVPINKYEDVAPAVRERLQADWNAPVRWPLYLVLLAIAGRRGAGCPHLLPGAPVDGRLSRPSPGLRRPHGARRAVAAVRAVLCRHQPRRYRPQGGGRARAARGLSAVEEEPRL